VLEGSPWRRQKPSSSCPLGWLGSRAEEARGLRDAETGVFIFIFISKLLAPKHPMFFIFIFISKLRGPSIQSDIRRTVPWTGLISPAHAYALRPHLCLHFTRPPESPRPWDRWRPLPTAPRVPMMAVQPTPTSHAHPVLSLHPAPFLSLDPSSLSTWTELRSRPLAHCALLRRSLALPCPIARRLGHAPIIHRAP
jgi:hypothetical protein